MLGKWTPLKQIDLKGFNGDLSQGETRIIFLRMYNKVLKKVKKLYNITSLNILSYGMPNQTDSGNFWVFTR